jgi:hypothetical protein
MEKSKKLSLWLIFFGLILILFAGFSTKVHFHDSLEYINIAKYFAGVNNINIFSCHSLIYPLIISLFLRIWPSLFMLKIINVLWIFLIGLVLLLWLKNKKAFLIFVFSPLTWYMSIQTTPILPATFFFLLGFIFFKKKDIRHSLFYSGLLLGLAFAFYTPVIMLIFLFILIYFWERGFSDFIKYVIALTFGFSVRLLADQLIFGSPFYTLIRFFGVNLLIILGVHPSYGAFNFLSQLSILIIIVAISPFLFRLHRLRFKKNKKILIFLIIPSLIFILRVPNIKYFMLISPLVILLLSKVLDEKEIKWHCILSIFLIIFLTGNYFTATDEILIKEDLEKISLEYNEDYIIGGPSKSAEYAVFLWKDRPYLIWFEDFDASLKNKTLLREYEFDFDAVFPLKSVFKISGSFERYENRTYQNYILISEKDHTFFDSEIEKCYEILCVHKR